MQKMNGCREANLDNASSDETRAYGQFQRSFGVAVIAPDFDCIIVGCGMSGLAAAYSLRSDNILALESGHGPGGRVRSQAAGDYWLNFGAHMFGGPETPIGKLVSEMNVPTAPIGGRLMGMAYGGKRLLRHPAESFPFLLPFTLRERLAMVRMGVKLRHGSGRFLKHMKRCDSDDANQRQLHALEFENRRTLSQAMGPMPPCIAAFLTAITERNGADPDDMAAGHALRSFANVWSSHAPGHNIIGGSSLVPQAMARALGDRVRYGHEVLEVVPGESRVTVRYRHGGKVTSARARTVIVAVPAPVAVKIIHGLPARALSALHSITYGPFLTVASRTTETGNMPWDGHYAIATPGRSFSVLFNMATTTRTGPRRSGGSLMLFRGARGASEMMERTDVEIEQAFKRDLLDLFPEATGNIAEMIVQRWPLGAPFAAPGRAAVQRDLTAPLGRIFLAGDYFEFPNMESAVTSGRDSARKVQAMLTNPPDIRAPT